MSRKREVLTHQAREMVVNLRKYFEMERDNKGPLISMSKVMDRVSAALHISITLVKNITKKNVSLFFLNVFIKYLKSL